MNELVFLLACLGAQCGYMPKGERKAVFAAAAARLPVLGDVEYEVFEQEREEPGYLGMKLGVIK